MCDLAALGRALHALQDSYSHEGYGPRRGHIRNPHRPDMPSSDLPKYGRMIGDTINKLKDFANKCREKLPCCEN
jgi:hypothetical protein